MTDTSYQAIVIGGSAAGLSATLAIARTLSSVICIDSGKPCNRYAKESHNFLTHDNDSPWSIKKTAREQIEKYPNAVIMDDEVTSIIKDDNQEFTVATKNNAKVFRSNSIVLAVGLDDNIESSDIKNLAQFWGNSIFTCGYCHGFEYAGKKAGLYVHNEFFLEMLIPIVYNWNKNLTVFSSTATFQQANAAALEKRGVTLIPDSSIVEVVGEGTQIKYAISNKGEKVELEVLYYAPPSVINMKDMITKLGVELDGMGFVKVDKQTQMTNIPGVFAAGDCTTMMRSLAIATQTGQCAGMSLTHNLFNKNWALS